MTLGVDSDVTVMQALALTGIAGFTAGTAVLRIVDSVSNLLTASSHASLASPKLTLAFGPWSQTEFFVNAGRGFHSNDARGA